MRSLAQSLLDHPMAMLRGVAQVNGLSLLSNHRDEAAAQLAELLGAPGAAEVALAACSTGAQDAWRSLLAAGGRMKVPAFIRQFGAIRPAGPGRLERDTPWQKPATAAEELWYRGLIYRAFADLAGAPAEYFYVPTDLLPDVPPVPQPTNSAESIPVEPAPSAPVHGSRALSSLSVDMTLLLGMLQETPLPLSKSGGWRASDEKRLLDGLLMPDKLRLRLLVTLALDAGWFRPEHGELRVVRGSATEWLRSSLWEQMTRLFEIWAHSARWNDLRRVPELQAEGEWQNNPVVARRAILAAVAQKAADHWLPLTALVTHIKQMNPDFQRPDGNYASWYIKDLATGSYVTGFEGWESVEGRLICFVITHVLYWLGAVELSDPEPQGFRLSRSGAAWIANAVTPAMPRPSQMLVQEDFTVQVPLLAPNQDRIRLLRFAERHSTGTPWAQPQYYRITRSSLHRARESGLDPERILQFLHKACSGSIPVAVSEGLKRASQTGGQKIRLTRSVVLRVAEAATLAALRGDAKIAPLLGDLISAQAVLVPEEHRKTILDALNELGYGVQEE
jgi:hypothetical protein